MHRDLLSALVANVRKRAAEGDCPVTPSYPVETLENAILDLAAEAPAEGAGEALNFALGRLDYMAAACEEYWTSGPQTQTAHGVVVRKADLISVLAALRARSSAPEAREGDLVGYANAEFMRRLKNWREAVPNTIRSDETFLKAVSSESYPVALYTHPAAPSADNKLRIAVEALESERERHERVADFAFDAAREASERNEVVEEDVAMRRMNAHNERVSTIDQALAALKAEGA